MERIIINENKKCNECIFCKYDENNPRANSEPTKSSGNSVICEAYSVPCM